MYPRPVRVLASWSRALFGALPVIVVAFALAACSDDSSSSEVEPASDASADSTDASEDADASADAGADVDASADAPPDAVSEETGAPDASGDADASGEAGAIAPVFDVPGTRVGEVFSGTYSPSSVCAGCHGATLDDTASPHGTWSGSLMAHAGRDPLFFAQLTTANQDVPGVGSYCLRCHVPAAVATGHVLDSTGGSLDEQDRDGVTCHLCHSMVDPLYQAGVSPPNDESILAGLASRPSRYGNAMFVLDPTGLRRGPYADSTPPHPAIQSPFYRTGELCGTCHDVGNPAVLKQPDGTYRYADPTKPASEDPLAQFPLERTYSEWRLSAFARGGVDMGGRFGGPGATTVSTCQDCHMPRTEALGCIFGPSRSDLAKHEFAGASAWVLDIIALANPDADQAALARGRASAVDMLSRAATLEVSELGPSLRVRVMNQSGHKLPSGHIEGRRVWVNVRFFDASKALVAEYGRWDPGTAELDEASTTVFEMVIGLSPAAAESTGLPAGPTAHMSLADVIVKDNRIPPRGFVASDFAAAGAPAVGAPYADGEHWADVDFPRPVGATSATVTLYYQTVTREYIEALRDGNHTDGRGQALHDLWEQTGKGPPIAITTEDVTLTP